jgi:formate/nitrite transporter FocA (FNT family)
MLDHMRAGATCTCTACVQHGLNAARDAAMPAGDLISHSLVPTTLGNAIGGAFFMAALYCVVFGRGKFLLQF